MNLEVKIIKGTEAVKLLKNKAFISKWMSLAKGQKSVTVHQEYPFVSTWYHQYSNRFLPVFIIGFNKNSEVIAILPLAQDINNLKLMHAGAWQAEYKGWVCDKNFEETFPIQALIAIKNNFKIKKWEWGWLSPRLTTNWFHSKILNNKNIFVKYEVQDSPLLDVQNEERIHHIKTKKSMRVKINRFIKRGDFYLERITTKEKALRIFDTLAAQNDFRQMAIHDVAPFNLDTNKKSFHIERLNFKKENHFTVLWCNNKPIAFNFGECDADTVYLGVMSFDPTDSKNSPGQILIIKLAEFIKEEGFRYLDLTPGGDNYKERFSNLHQKLFSLEIYFNKKDFVNSKLKKFPKNTLKRAIKKFHVEPETLITKVIYNPLKKLKKMYSGLYCSETFIYYKYNCKDFKKFELTNNKKIKKNNYSDLLLYRGTDKSTILSNALKSFSFEDILYTITIDNELAHYSWITKRTDSKIFSNSNTKFNFPENSIIIYNCFTNPHYRKQGFHTETLKKIINEYAKNNIRGIYIGVAENNNISKNVIEKVDFKEYYKFTRKIFLWKTQEKKNSL